MKKFFLFFLLCTSVSSFAQIEWTVCNAPIFTQRVDDIFMVNTLVGYAVGGDGKIVKTTDGGNNWTLIKQQGDSYFRSVEFFNEQIGFAGAFQHRATDITLLKTIDGGDNWTDLTPQLPLKARAGICGLSIVDANTIYACGNWFQDAGYIVKSTDAGATWSIMNLDSLATSIIDINFINKDTGFATGKGILPMEFGVILYTEDGGVHWTVRYTTNISREYCWKIQRLTPQIYFVSVQDVFNTPPKILRSNNGGLSWQKLQIQHDQYNIQGVGFIDSLHGWTGGDSNGAFQTSDGGVRWAPLGICPRMNRVFRVNDTTMFATGTQIWKYKKTILSPPPPPPAATIEFTSLNCHPNPVKGQLTIDVKLNVATHSVLMLVDGSGRRVKVIDNTERAKGTYQFFVNTAGLSPGIYYVTLMTHEDNLSQKVVVAR